MWLDHIYKASRTSWRSSPGGRLASGPAVRAQAIIIQHIYKAFHTEKSNRNQKHFSWSLHMGSVTRLWFIAKQRATAVHEDNALIHYVSAGYEMSGRKGISF